MAFARDIEARIAARFKDFSRAQALLASVTVRADERDRVIRCILELSESDHDSLEAWVKKANVDYRDIIWYAEYDGRNVRKHDFSQPFPST